MKKTNKKWTETFINQRRLRKLDHSALVLQALSYGFGWLGKLLILGPLCFDVGRHWGHVRAHIAMQLRKHCGAEMNQHGSQGAQDPLGHGCGRGTVVFGEQGALLLGADHDNNSMRESG